MRVSCERRNAGAAEVDNSKKGELGSMARRCCQGDGGVLFSLTRETGDTRWDVAEIVVPIARLRRAESAVERAAATPDTFPPDISSTRSTTPCLHFLSISSVSRSQGVSRAIARWPSASGDAGNEHRYGPLRRVRPGNARLMWSGYRRRRRSEPLSGWIGNGGEEAYPCSAAGISGIRGFLPTGCSVALDVRDQENDIWIWERGGDEH